MLGNIDQEKMDEYQNMFENLPTIFKTSALVDRIHGFIKGWDIPIMNEGLKVSGWALNSEYFCTIMHLLRDDASYRAIVDKIVDYPEDAATRNTEAVKRIATAYLKLLFPNVRSAVDVNVREFQQYCLRPAVKMRGIILKQLGILDSQYRGMSMPHFSVKDLANETV
jgi:ATP-dependent Lon protease